MRTPPEADGPIYNYKEVRGLARGLALLRVMNTLPGSIASTTELARRCGLDRTTAKRLLETLRMQGYVRQGERDGQYELTFEVRGLSEGFTDETWVAQVAAPLMRAALPDLLWPSDLATVRAGFMVVRESTHRWSRLSQDRAMIGTRMPLFVTALGRAYLAACSDSEREAALELLARRSDWVGTMARDRPAVQQMVRETRRRGHAVNDGEWWPRADFAAVAVPVFSGEHLLACLSLIFPKSAVAEPALRKRFVPALQALAERIGKGSRPWIEA